MLHKWSKRHELHNQPHMLSSAPKYALRSVATSEAPHFEDLIQFHRLSPFNVQPAVIEYQCPDVADDPRHQVHKDCFTQAHLQGDGACLDLHGLRP